MIYTFTANPALDINVSACELIPNKVTRTRDAVYSANGKGLNVTYALRHFGTQSVILGFFGGFTGEYIIDSCSERGYGIKPVIIEDTTRINYFIASKESDYSLVNEGAAVSAKEQEEFFTLLSSLNDMDVLTINGSSARGLSLSFYERIFDICRQKGTRVVVDMSTSMLGDLLKFKPLLIKPNDDELMEIFGLPSANEEQIIYALKKLNSMGAQNILLTLGKNGSYFYNGKNIYFCEAYPVKLKTSVCAGDSFLGAFLSVWLTNSEKIEEALKIASASGANTAESEGLGDFSMVDVYKESINVRIVC